MSDRRIMISALLCLTASAGNAAAPTEPEPHTPSVKETTRLALRRVLAEVQPHAGSELNQPVRTDPRLPMDFIPAGAEAFDRTARHSIQLSTTEADEAEHLQGASGPWRTA